MATRGTNKFFFLGEKDVRAKDPEAQNAGMRGKLADCSMFLLPCTSSLRCTAHGGGIVRMLGASVPAPCALHRRNIFVECFSTQAIHNPPVSSESCVISHQAGIAIVLHSTAYRCIVVRAVGCSNEQPQRAKACQGTPC